MGRKSPLNSWHCLAREIVGINVQLHNCRDLLNQYSPVTRAQLVAGKDTTPVCARVARAQIHAGLVMQTSVFALSARPAYLAPLPAIELGCAQSRDLSDDVPPALSKYQGVRGHLCSATSRPRATAH